MRKIDETYNLRAREIIYNRFMKSIHKWHIVYVFMCIHVVWSLLCIIQSVSFLNLLPVFRHFVFMYPFLHHCIFVWTFVFPLRFFYDSELTQCWVYSRERAIYAIMENTKHTFHILCGLMQNHWTLFSIKTFFLLLNHIRLVCIHQPHFSWTTLSFRTEVVRFAHQPREKEKNSQNFWCKTFFSQNAEDEAKSYIESRINIV